MEDNIILELLQCYSVSEPLSITTPGYETMLGTAVGLSLTSGHVQMKNLITSCIVIKNCPTYRKKSLRLFIPASVVNTDCRGTSKLEGIKN